MLRTISTPTSEGKNGFYVSNREPLLPNPLIKLPVGSIKPKGWLRHQLVLMADGMTGHLPELSPWCQFEGSAWASPEGQGDYGWEELPYWLRGFGDLGYVLGDERIVKEAKRWIEAILSSQEPDGWFGPRFNKENNDLWPNMIALEALKSFHEVMGDHRVLPFMTRYFRWQLSRPKEELLTESWQKVRGGDNLQSIYWLYNRTGGAWLLDLARNIHERTADWTSGIASWHGVNICQGFREPAQYYQLSHDKRHLEATERNYETVMNTYGQVPGGMFGADENCRSGYTDPRQGAETCSMVEFMHSDQILLMITGNPVYADRCEEIAFNSFPASMTPDLKGLHYLTAPNMVQLDKEDKSPMLQNPGTMLSYDPHEYRCCQHNAAQGWPYYAEHLWMATQDNGLAAVMYAASEVEARVGDGTKVKIVENTDYPFDETVGFELSTPRAVKFPLLLRIPRWCRDPKVCVNGQTDGADLKPLSYVMIERTWHDGDDVRLQLPMKVGLTTWTNNRDSVSIHRGPLTYSLMVGEKWVRYGRTDKWPSYEVYPTTPWDYGLIVNMKNPAESFEVHKRESRMPDQPFTIDSTPVRLAAKARRIPQWKQEPNGLIGALNRGLVKTAEPAENIELVPMGCARLRVSAFPIVS